LEDPVWFHNLQVYFSQYGRIHYILLPYHPLCFFSTIAYGNNNDAINGVEKKGIRIDKTFIHDFANPCNLNGVSDTWLKGYFSRDILSVFRVPVDSIIYRPFFLFHTYFFSMANASDDTDIIFISDIYLLIHKKYACQHETAGKNAGV
jgi:hypothetical protein